MANGDIEGMVVMGRRLMWALRGTARSLYIYVYHSAGGRVSDVMGGAGISYCVGGKVGDVNGYIERLVANGSIEGGGGYGMAANGDIEGWPVPIFIYIYNGMAANGHIEGLRPFPMCIYVHIIAWEGG